MGLIIMMIRYLVLMVALIEAATAATTHQVGDSVGWTVPPNASFYATWASAQKFSVGDTLEFQWTSTHDVLEVLTKTEYEDCSGMNGTPSSSSPVRITLTNTTARYFICTVGTHCASGQKLAVTNVAATNSTTTPPSSGPPPPSGASASIPTTAAALLPALLSTIAMISFLVITI